jgi:hypothetical protein
VTDTADWTATLTLSTGDQPDATWTVGTVPAAPGDLPDWTLPETGVAGGGGGGSGPAGLTGVAGWWDATRISGVADAALLAAWPDSSGNGYDLAQATGANQPTYYSTTGAGLINGKAAVTFDGANTWMLTAALAEPQPFTLAAVAQNTLTTVNLQKPLAGSTLSATVHLYANLSATTFISCWGYAGATVVAGNYTPRTGQAHLFVLGANGATSYAYFDGAAATGAGGSNAMSGAFYVGGIGPSFSWQGMIGEVMVWPRLLSAGQVTQLHGYCQDKWNVP